MVFLKCDYRRIIVWAHQMEPPSLLISWVNPFPGRFINRTIFSFVMRLNRMNALTACCHFSISIGSFLYQRAKPPQRIILFINILGTGLTPRACMGDAGSIWWVPAYRDWHCSCLQDRFRNLSWIFKNFFYFVINHGCTKLRSESVRRRAIRLPVCRVSTPSLRFLSSVLLCSPLISLGALGVNDVNYVKIKKQNNSL